MATTLKDIARALGVTTTTVHRALQGKEGVSEETRQKVQRTAAEMGYRANYMAAALKRREMRFAIALPEPTFDNRYYYSNLWKGARAFFGEVSEFGLQALDFAYPLSPNANGGVLREIYEKQGDQVDGLLTMAVDNPQSSYFIEKFAEKNIPVVLLGSDMHKDKRFCCVKSYDEMAGSLAAELLTAFDGSFAPKKVIVTGHFGQLGMPDQYYNVAGFESYLHKYAPHIRVEHIQGERSAVVRDRMIKALDEDKSIFAIYSSSARYTIRMSEAVLSLGLEGKIKLIGNDLFEESRDLLKQGVLSAIIDKKIPQQSYLGMKVLFDYVVKGEYPPSGTIYVSPEVVLKSNADREIRYIEGGKQV